MASAGLAASRYSAIAEDLGRPEAVRRAAKLQAQAEQLRQEERAADALKPALEALRLFREAGDESAAADAQQAVIASQAARGRLEEARCLAEAELQRFRDAEDRAGAAKMMLALAGCSQGSQALRHAEEAREEFKELGLQQHEALASLEVASARLRVESAEDALEAAEETEELFRALGEAKGEACALRATALAKFRLEDTEGALAAGRKACSLYRELRLERLEALEQVCLADCLLRFRPAGKDATAQLEEAVTLADSASQIFDRLADARGKSLATDRRVRACLAQGEPQRAREMAEEALQDARAKEEKVVEAAMHQTLVAVYLATRSVDKAIQSAKDAAAVLEALEDHPGQAGAWHLAAQLCLQDTSKAGEALQCAQTARKEHKCCMVSVDEEAAVLQTLSAAHLANGDAKNALEAACTGRDLCKEAEAAASEARCSLRAASAHVHLGDLEAALSAASDAQELFREANDQRAEASAAHLVARLQLQRQDYSAARLAADTARALLRQTSELGREVGMLLLSSQAGSMELGAGAQPGAGSKAARTFFEGRGRNKVLATSKEAVALSKRLGSKHLAALARLAEVRAQVSNGLLEEASAELQEVLTTLQEVGDQRAAGAAKLLQANLSILRGAPDVAVAKEAVECFRASGDHDVALAQAVVSRLQQTRSAAPRAQPAGTGTEPTQAQSGAPAPSDKVVPKPATIDKMSLALPERVKYTLTELVAEAIGQEGMDEDRTLMETGMTSIASIMLRDRIQAEFPEIPEMDLTFVFDYPTIREMTGFVLTQLPNDV